MDSRTLSRVDGIARAMSRSRAWVINQAVERDLATKNGLSMPLSAVSKRLGRAGSSSTILKGWESKRATEGEQTCC